MREKYTFKVSTGITSILMIFVVLCITSFGVLSYSSANADLKLSKKNADNIEKYYKAYGNVMDKYSIIDEIIYNVRQENIKGEEYYKELEKRFTEKLVSAVYDSEEKNITLSEKINDKQNMVMVINVFPDTDAKRCETDSVKVETKAGIYEPETIGLE